MAFTLPKDSNNNAYVGNLDSNNNVAVPTEQYIKVNGVYLPVSATNPVPTQEQVGGAAVSASNPLPTQLMGSNATKLTSDGTSAGLTPYIGSGLGSGDGNGTNALLLATGTYGLAYNETTWDRVRNNTQGTLLASAARTASVYTANQTNYNAKGLILFFDVTVASGTGGLTFWLSIPDPSSVSVPQAKLNATAITSISAGAIAIYPGLNTAPTGISDIVNMAVPRIFNIYVQAGDSTSYTYSLGYALIN